MDLEQALLLLVNKIVLPSLLDYREGSQFVLSIMRDSNVSTASWSMFNAVI